MKAQHSLRGGPPDPSSTHSSSSETGPSSIKDHRVAQIKTKLAEMQRRKGKAVNLTVDMERPLEPEEREKREEERLRRESKHACVQISPITGFC